MDNQTNFSSVIEKLKTYDISSTDIDSAKLWLSKQCYSMGLDELETNIALSILMPKSNSRLNLMVFGYKRHGKDTVCEYLRDNYAVSFASSSYTACELFLFDKIKEKFGYKTVDEAFNDRGNHRQLWYEEIKAYNVRNGLDALGKVIFENNSVYCGIRDKEEFEALKAGGYFDLAIWVDASDRLPPEEAESMKLTKEDADIVITNNEDLASLYKKLDKIFDTILKP
ncbi:TPA: hypothetical protein ACPVZG_000068 [Vibrio parahaemolyticus]